MRKFKVCVLFTFFCRLTFLFVIFATKYAEIFTANPAATAAYRSPMVSLIPPFVFRNGLQASLRFGLTRLQTATYLITLATVIFARKEDAIAYALVIVGDLNLLGLMC